MKHQLHPSITQLYQTYPNLKLPKICVNMNMAPVVAIQLHEVLKNQEISHPKKCENKVVRNVATKRTGSAVDMHKVLTKISRSSDIYEKTTQDKQCSSDEKVVSVDPFKEHFEQEFDHAVPNQMTENTTSPSQRAFLKGFGLTPNIPTKCEPLLACNDICKPVQKSALEIKRHKSKHVKCQFCKKKFKSVEDKQIHVQNSCVIMKGFDSPLPKVYLENISFNVDLKNLHQSAFSNLDPLQEDEVKPVAIQPISSPYIDGVIVLSDDDLESAPANATTAGDPESLKNVPASSEKTVNASVSIVRPCISIINSLFSNINTSSLSDFAFLTELVSFLKPAKSTVEAVMQTNLPSAKDIQLNSSRGTCEFKHLWVELIDYKVPVHISSGSFHVGYVFKSDKKEVDNAAQWTSLKMIDASRRAATNCANIHVHNTLQSNKSTCAPTLPRWLDVSSVSSTPNNVITGPSRIMNGANVNSTIASVLAPTTTSSPFETSFYLMQTKDMPLPIRPINKPVHDSENAVSFTLKKITPTRLNHPRVYGMNRPTYSQYNQISKMPSDTISTQVSSNSMAVPANRVVQLNRSANLPQPRYTNSTGSGAASRHLLNNSLYTQIRDPPIVPFQRYASPTNVSQMPPVVTNQSAASYTGRSIYFNPTDRPKVRVKTISELQ